MTVARQLDRESVPKYSISIKALDNPVTDNRRHAILSPVIIVIDDINDNSPEWTNLGNDEIYSAKVVERTTVNTKVCPSLSFHSFSHFPSPLDPKFSCGLQRERSKVKI